MPLNDAQLEARQRYIGASDVPALLGLDPRRTAWDVWADKRGLVPRSADTDATDAGRRFEPAILGWADEQLGKLRIPDAPIGAGVLRANPDAIIAANGEPVDAKTSGLFGPTNDEWGPDGSDEVPDRIIVQMQAQMLCTERELSHVAAFIGRRGFAMFHVRRSQRIIDSILHTCDAFQALVANGTPPTDSRPSESTYRRMMRTETCVEIPDDVYDAASAARDARLAAEKAEDAANATLHAALGTADSGRTPSGKSVRFSLVTTRRLDQSDLRAAHPELVAQFTRASSYRKLTFKGIK